MDSSADLRGSEVGSRLAPRRPEPGGKPRTARQPPPSPEDPHSPSAGGTEGGRPERKTLRLWRAFSDPPRPRLAQRVPTEQRRPHRAPQRPARSTATAAGTAGTQRPEVRPRAPGEAASLGPRRPHTSVVLTGPKNNPPSPDQIAQEPDFQGVCPTPGAATCVFKK